MILKLIWILCGECVSCVSKLLFSIFIPFKKKIKFYSQIHLISKFRIILFIFAIYNLFFSFFSKIFSKISNSIKKLKCAGYKFKFFILDIFYTLIFLIKNEKLKNFFYVYYMSKFFVSEKSNNSDIKADSSVYLCKKSPITVDYDLAKRMGVNKNTEGFNVVHIKKAAEAWTKPVEYPLKPSKKLLKLLKIKKTRYNYGNTDSIANLEYNMRIVKEPLNPIVKINMEKYLAKQDIILERKKDLNQFLSVLKVKNPELYKRFLQKDFNKRLKSFNPEIFNARLNRNKKNTTKIFNSEVSIGTAPGNQHKRFKKSYDGSGGFFEKYFYNKPKPQAPLRRKTTELHILRILPTKSKHNKSYNDNLYGWNVSTPRLKFTNNTNFIRLKALLKKEKKTPLDLTLSEKKEFFFLKKLYDPKCSLYQKLDYNKVLRKHDLIVQNSWNYRLSHVSYPERRVLLKYYYKNILAKKNSRNYADIDKLSHVSNVKKKYSRLYTEETLAECWPATPSDLHVLKSTQRLFKKRCRSNVWIDTSDGPRNKLEMLKQLPHNHLRTNKNDFKFNPKTFFPEIFKDELRGKKLTYHTKFYRKSFPENMPFDYPPFSNLHIERLFDPKVLSYYKWHQSPGSLMWQVPHTFDKYFWVFDLYIVALPLVLTLLFVHFSLAESILCKFKSQQHYNLNFWLLNGGLLGSIFYYYVYYKNNYTIYNLYFLSKPVAPFYILLYSWWIFLILSFFVVLLFCLFAPTSELLRGKSGGQTPSNTFHNFIPVAVGLILPILLTQTNLPYWKNFETFLFSINNNFFHLGFTYIFFIFIYIAIISIAIFYIVFTCWCFFKFWYTKDKYFLIFLKKDFFLYNIEDNSTIIDNDYITSYGLPIDLAPSLGTLNFDDHDVLDEYIPPDGYFVAFGEGMWGEEEWTGSYSKKFFILWYLLMFLLYFLEFKFFFFLSISSFFFFNFFLLLLVVVPYLAFVQYYLKVNILRKTKHKIILYSFLFLILFSFFFFFKDFLFVFGII